MNPADGDEAHNGFQYLVGNQLLHTHLAKADNAQNLLFLMNSMPVYV